MRILVVLVVLLTSAPASADRVIRDVGDPGHVDVHLHPDHVVAVAFDSKIVHHSRPPWRHVAIKDEPGNVLLIWPRRARSGTYGTIHVHTSQGEVVLRLVGASSEDVASLVQIRHKSAKQVWDEAVGAKAREIADEEIRECREESGALREALEKRDEDRRTASLSREAADKDWLSDFLREPAIEPLPNDAPEQGISIEHDEWVAATRRRLAARFWITNSEPVPLQVTSLQLLNHRRGNHAGAVVISESAEGQEGVLAVIPPRSRVSGIAQVLEPSLTGPTLVYAMTVSGEPVMSEKVKVLDLTKIFPDEDPPPDPEAGVVTVSVKGTYGAIWLGDGAGLDKSAATSLIGLGVGISYGVSRLLAFEAEIMGAKTGDARFADVTYNGMTGTLDRSATLGRAQGGVMLRFGEEWYQVVGRAGVGLQGASQSAYHEVGGVRMDGPKVPFDWSTLFTFGAGLDLRLGPLRAGVSLSVVSPWGDYDLFRRAIEAGAHIGLRWN